MKRIQDDLNLRGAFSPAPEDLKNMLVHTANSVKEEEKVKNYRWGAILVAALIIMATMSAAVAASEWIGWTDFFSKFYNVTLPSEAQEIMAQTERQAFQVGPLTLTVQETLCDGENAFTSIVATTSDGSPAVITSWGEWDMPICANGMDNEAVRLGVDRKTSWMDAAQAVDQPLYAVRAIPEVDHNLMNGEQMEDFLHNAEGGFVNFSLVAVDAEKVGDALPLTYYLYVAEIDAETGDVKQEWKERKEGEIPVNSSVLAEKTYAMDSEYEFNGFKLENILIEMRVTGGYVTTTFTAPEGATEEAWWDETWSDLVNAMTLCDAAGERFKSGVSLSMHADVSNWPTVTVHETIGISELPETVRLIIRDDAESAEPVPFEVVLPAQ